MFSKYVWNIWIISQISFDFMRASRLKCTLSGEHRGRLCSDFRTVHGDIIEPVFFTCLHEPESSWYNIVQHHCIVMINNLWYGHRIWIWTNKRQTELLWFSATQWYYHKRHCVPTNNIQCYLYTFFNCKICSLSTSVLSNKIKVSCNILIWFHLCFKSISTNRIWKKMYRITTM